MKAALLCTLAPRPRLLLMDEPFTGMDALVKDELVRGLLESSGEEGWSVLVCSHDIGELESLADWVGILDAGRLRLSEPMERVWERFRRVEVVLPDSVTTPTRWPATWLSVERSGQRLSFITSDAGGEGGEDGVRRRLPAGSRVTLERASLREVFVALARAGAREAATPVAAAEEVAA